MVRVSYNEPMAERKIDMRHVMSFADHQLRAHGTYCRADGAPAAKVGFRGIPVIMPTEDIAYTLRAPSIVVSHIAGLHLRRLQISPTAKTSIEFSFQPLHFTDVPCPPGYVPPMDGPRLDLVCADTSDETMRESQHSIWFDIGARQYRSDALYFNDPAVELPTNELTGDMLIALDGLLLALPLIRQDIRG